MVLVCLAYLLASIRDFNWLRLRNDKCTPLVCVGIIIYSKERHGSSPSHRYYKSWLDRRKIKETLIVFKKSNRRLLDMEWKEKRRKSISPSSFLYKILIYPMYFPTKLKIVLLNFCYVVKLPATDQDINNFWVIDVRLDEEST